MLQADFINDLMNVNSFSRFTVWILTLKIWKVFCWKTDLWKSKGFSDFSNFYFMHLEQSYLNFRLWGNYTKYKYKKSPQVAISKSGWCSILKDLTPAASSSSSSASSSSFFSSNPFDNSELPLNPPIMVKSYISLI